MPKARSLLNTNSTSRLKKFYKQLAIDNPELDIKELKEKFNKYILNDVRSIKDCSEKSIVDSYITFGEEYFTNTIPPIDDSVFDKIRNNVKQLLLHEYTDKSFNNNIDIYFNEVKREYILHPQNESDDLEFIPENRDIFIKNNLKLVVSCAKRYQNLGLPFEDLIQIGNLGLLTAFDKFDTSRQCLRNAIIEDIKAFDKDDFTYEEAKEIIENNHEYQSATDKTMNSLPEEGFDSKEDFILWTKQNIKTAVFASVAFLWIRAYILQELGKYSSTIKFPKGYKEDGYASIIYLDSINPYTNDNYNDNELYEVSNNEFAQESEYITNMERNEMYNDVITKALAGLSNLDRRIIKKKFGIGFPYASSNNEIAENEGISLSEVKSSINRSMNHIYNTITPDTRDMIIELMS